MSKAQTIEEYKSPDLRFFTIQNRQMLCQSFGKVNPEYKGFEEEDL